MGLLPMDADLLPPSDDRVFKLLLMQEEAKPVLIDLVSAIIGRAVKDVVVRNSELTSQDIQEKDEWLDVNCRVDDDTQVDIEMQASRVQEDFEAQPQNLKGKGIFYLCDLHSSQPARGIRRYDRLAQTWQVTFCMYPVFPHREEFINSFSLRHDMDNELLSDQLRVMYVELSKLKEVLKKPVVEMSDLEKWAVFFRYANVPRHRKVVNHVIESKEALAMAGELLMSISQDERERAVFRSRRMAETDRLSDLATAEDRGLRRGIDIGRSEGREEGSIKVRREIAQMMLSEGKAIEEIKRFTGLAEVEIRALGVRPLN